MFPQPGVAKYRCAVAVACTAALAVLTTLAVAPRVATGQTVTSDPERVLIQLRGTPLARTRATLGATRQALDAQRLRVAATIVRLVAQARGRAVAKSDVITDEYSVVFHGFAARVPLATQAQVRRLPDVQAVYPDAEVHATDAQSVALIQAPAFWSTYSYHGAGKVIAIVDTGVDYVHPDLGGCFGAGCKVIGGYDFVNRDTDPVDDNGHGTHVASIAAGIGAAVPGVAPDASILAYKVLDATGSGSDSRVMAGIERAVDPNHDGNPADHADVINLSLGRTGDADDPESQAVDNATAAGVLVVASAGNDGRSYFTVGTPAAARTALTVGATDETDQVADFSSRGPSAGAYGLKPEIVAPGVTICGAQAAGVGGQTCVDESHIQLTGTSMAAPQVAGAAALLRGVFPTLTPAEVKSLLVQNSVDLGYDAFKQGAGRLDVAAAGNARTVVTPATVSFGRDNLSLSTWTATQPLTVRNIDTSSRAYALSTPPLPTGISATFTPSSFTLGPDETTTVAFDLAVDNTVVPDQNVSPYAYDNSVVLITSGTQQQRVPFAFLKTPGLLVLNQLKLTWVKGGFPDVVSTLHIGGVFDATELDTSYFASFASTLQGGFTVGVVTSSSTAPDQMTFPGSQCSTAAKAVHCRGSNGEKADFKQSKQNVFKVTINARKRLIPFEQVAGSAAVVDLVPTIGGANLHDKIRCGVSFRGGRFQMSCQK